MSLTKATVLVTLTHEVNLSLAGETLVVLDILAEFHENVMTGATRYNGRDEDLVLVWGLA